MKTNEYTFQPSYNRITNKDQLAVGGLNGLRDTALGHYKGALWKFSELVNLAIGVLSLEMGKPRPVVAQNFCLMQ